MDHGSDSTPDDERPDGWLNQHFGRSRTRRRGVGKSHLIQALGQQACVLGWRVRYTSSADLLLDLRASLADQTLPQRVRYYARFDLLIDEFGFDRLERTEAPQAASLLYKVVDARGEQRSTALVTNIDFRA